jgi:hypothetical protein
MDGNRIYYISLEELRGNPEILTYIARFLTDEQKNMAQRFDQNGQKFLIEYSTEDIRFITSFMTTEIIEVSKVLYYRANDFSNNTDKTH